MAAQTDFVKESAVKSFIKAQELRSTAEAVTALEEGINGLIRKVIVEAGERAQDDKKKTIMPEHIAYALEKHVGREDLDWQQILGQVLQETPADLGKISKGIRDHIAQNTKP